MKMASLALLLVLVGCTGSTMLERSRVRDQTPPTVAAVAAHDATSEAGQDPETLEAWVRTCLPGYVLRRDDEGKHTAVVSPAGEILDLTDAGKYIKSQAITPYWSTHGMVFLSKRKLAASSAKDAARVVKLLHALSHGPTYVRKKIYRPRRIPSGWVVAVDHDFKRYPGMIRSVQPYELTVDTDERVVQLRQRIHTYRGSASVYTNTVMWIYERERKDRRSYIRLLDEELWRAWEREQKADRTQKPDSHQQPPERDK